MKIRSFSRAVALACASALALAGAPAFAQASAPPQVPWTGGAHWTPDPTFLIGFDSVSGQPCIIGQTTTCLLNISGSFSSTVSGFRPTAYGTPISATTTAATQALPAGTQVVATNTGTVGAYCALGGSATLASQYIASGGGWFNFAISGDTQLTCITASGSTTVNTAGGSGLPTGTGGGGGGGGGGGAVTAASGSYSSGALALGAIVDLGTGASPGANTVNGRLAAVTTALGAPTQAPGMIAAAAYTLNSSTANYPSGDYMAPASSLPTLTMSGGNGHITGFTFTGNDPTAGSWTTSSQLEVDVYSTAPTMGSDRATYSVTSGTGAWVGSYLCSFLYGVMGDGEFGYCTSVGTPVYMANGQSFSFTLNAFTGSGSAVGGSKSFTFKAVVAP